MDERNSWKLFLSVTDCPTEKWNEQDFRFHAVHSNPENISHCTVQIHSINSAQTERIIQWFFDNSEEKSLQEGKVHNLPGCGIRTQKLQRTWMGNKRCELEVCWVVSREKRKKGKQSFKDKGKKVSKRFSFWKLFNPFLGLDT